MGIFSVLKDEKVIDVGYTTMWIYLTVHLKFYVYFTINFFKGWSGFINNRWNRFYILQFLYKN